jgi:type II secretory pathway component PulC
MKTNLNENKNQPEVSEEKLKELGILKVISVVIGEDEETKYRVITNEGETKFVSASELLSE